MSDKEDRSGGLFRRRPTESVSCVYVYTGVLVSTCTCMYMHVYMCVCACVHVFVHYISCLKLQYAAIFFEIT